MKKILLVGLLALILPFGAMAGGYTKATKGVVLAVQAGTQPADREEPSRWDSSGSAIGAAIGSAVGYAVGGENRYSVGSVAGLLGGVIGKSIEAKRRIGGYETIIELDDGRVVSVATRSRPAFSAGQKVFMTENGTLLPAGGAL